MYHSAPHPGTRAIRLLVALCTRYDTRVIRINLKLNSRIGYDLDSSVIEHSYVKRETRGSMLGSCLYFSVIHLLVHSLLLYTLSVALYTDCCSVHHHIVYVLYHITNLSDPLRAYSCLSIKFNLLMC